MKKGKVTIIWGGQFGSEGKGQIAAHIQTVEHHDYAVRVGGPNAGHTFYCPDKDPDAPHHKVVVQSIPTAAYLG